MILSYLELWVKSRWLLGSDTWGTSQAIPKGAQGPPGLHLRMLWNLFGEGEGSAVYKATAVLQSFPHIGCSIRVYVHTCTQNSRWEKGDITNSGNPVQSAEMESPEV